MLRKILTFMKNFAFYEKKINFMKNVNFYEIF